MTFDDGTRPPLPQTRQAHPARPARIPVCHPERPHAARGLCVACYGVAYLSEDDEPIALPIRRPHGGDRGPTREHEPERRTNLEVALGLADYWRDKLVTVLEENVLLKQEIAESLLRAEALLRRGEG